jgi:hypothetical protein
MDPVTPPRLAIRCSSAEGQAWLERVAAELLARMPREVAERLARRVLVFALDGRRHSAFVQGMGGPQDATEQLALERVRQGPAAVRTSEPLAVIILHLEAGFRHSLAATLAHELAHVELGHTEAAAVAVAPLSDDELTAREREADTLAERWWRSW